MIILVPLFWLLLLLLGGRCKPIHGGRVVKNTRHPDVFRELVRDQEIAETGRRA